MPESKQMSRGSLVWAKVEPHPWWPGKIIKTIVQQQQPVYKISFFADPTYSYLHQHQLLPFHTTLPSPNPLPQPPALQRAVRLAHAHALKTTQPATPCPTSNEQFQSVPEPLEQQITEMLPQNLIILQQEEGVSDSPNIEQLPQTAISTLMDDITSQNVLDVYEEQRKVKQQNYCYERRKEEIRFQDKLKQKLLQRYNLLNTSHNNSDSSTSRAYSKPIIQITVSGSHLRKQKRIFKPSQQRKVMATDQIDQLRVHCLRKISELLKNSTDSRETVRRHTLELMRRMLILADNNHLKLKSLFVTLVRTLSRATMLSCEEKTGDFKHYMERLQGEKGEDEEGSKLTQIDTSIN